MRATSLNKTFRLREDSTVCEHKERKENDTVICVKYLYYNYNNLSKYFSCNGAGGGSLSFGYLILEKETLVKC